MIIPLSQSVVNSAIKDGSGNTITDTYQIKLTAGTGISLDDAGNISVSGSLTDTKVTQAYSASTDSFPLLATATKGTSSTDSRGATTALLCNKVYIIPSTGKLYVGALESAGDVSITGSLSATSGTINNSGILTASLVKSGDLKDYATSTDVASATHTHSQYLTEHPAITAGADTTPTSTLAHGGTFTAITGVTKDGNGHVTALATTTYTLPASGDTDKKTSSSNKTGAKQYLVTATAQSTSGQTTYSNSGCYIGTDNKLYSNSKLVLTSDDLSTIYQVKGNITKLEAESAASNAYMKGKTSSAAGTSTTLNGGEVFNLTEAASIKLNGSSTATTVPAGSNILWVKDSGWDKLSSNFDLSGYQTALSSSNKLSVDNINFSTAQTDALGSGITSTKVSTYDGYASTINGKAPTSHASTDTTYGASTDTKYGHAMASSTSPKMDGTASAGTETAKFARGDHVHPTDTSRQATIISTTATIAVADWNNKSKAVTVTGVTATNTVCVSYHSDTEAECAKANVKCTAQAANSLTFTCDSVPTVAVKMNVLIIP